MPKLIFTQEEIDGYLKERTYHHFYERTVEIAKAMAVHADGTFPDCLIKERRPHEPQEVMDYREKIFIAKTKPTFTKIFSSLQKIRRSSDWSIKFEGEFSKVNPEETLEIYTGEKYPYFTSLTNWVFSLLLRKYLIDPNAVVLVYPIDRDIPENEILKPIATIFDSVNVIDFVEEDYCVLYNPVGAVFLDSKGKEVIGKSYYVVTTQQILKYDQVDRKGNFKLVDEFDHEMGILPAFKLKGTLIDQVENMYLYESRVAGIIPELDEAIREYSDLQAAKVMHIYPERWEFTNAECTNCKGLGRVNEVIEQVTCQVQCKTCSGRGYVVAGPYSKIMVKPAGMGEKDIPTPPAGYVEKDIEIVKVMEESVNAHIYNALSAINFEFLAKTPLSESGIAKEVDKDELNNTVHSIAEDIVSVMDNIFRVTAYLRYKELYSIKDLNEMLPIVSVPEKFDILSSVHIQEELVKAKTDGLNPVLKSALEVSYASQRFNTDPEIRDRLTLILMLDPLPNVTEDEKMSRLSNKGITIEAYVISSNIQQFVRIAIEEDPNFAEKEAKEQRAVMVAFAQIVIAATTPVVLESADTGLDENGDPIQNNDDITGKIPLAVQQLSLAATRAADSGDKALAATIKAKINQLLGKLVDTADAAV